MLAEREEAQGESQSRELARFALLAQAVAGRKVGVLGNDTEPSYTDGEAIFLHELPEPWLTASLVLQAGLLAVGSLEPGVLTRLAGRRLLRQRYLTLEAVRAADLLEMVIPARTIALLRDLYDGPVPASAQQSLAWAGEPGRRVPTAPEWLGTVKPIKVLLATPGGSDGTPTDARSPIEDALRQLDDEEESERSRILELLSSPIQNPFASLIQRFLGMGRAPGESDGGAELPIGGATTGPVGPNAKSAQAPPGLTLELAGAAHGRSYPEWDFHRDRYRPNWCSVAEFDPPRPEPGEEPQPISTVDPRLRRQLARLGLTHERHRRQGEGDVIDLTALVELVVDRAALQDGDSRVYETKRRTAHDLGVLVLLDATGSTGESTEGRKVFDEQRLLAARLTAALDELGDRTATYAFYSRGRHSVHFLRVKGFDDRFDQAAQRRLQWLSPGGYTRLGAAIRHATHLLSDYAGTTNMLLVVVGDGLPYDDGYEHRYAHEDSRQALREAVAQGVGCVCLSVRSSTDDEVLEHVWGAVPHRRLEDADALSRHVLPLFRDALGTAGASRRSLGAIAS